MKGRNYSTLYGKFALGDPITVYSYKGLLRARRLAKKIHIPMTRKLRETMSVFATLAKIANTLPIEGRTGRARWGAATEYSAYEKGKESITRWAWYFRRKGTRFQATWFTLFMAKNLLAAASGMSWPRLVPQIVKDPPPAPIIKWAKYNKEGNCIEGEFHLLPLPGEYSDKVVRIYLAGRYAGLHIQPYIHKLIPIKDYSKKDFTVVPFKFDHIRCSGVRFRQENLYFRDMAYGVIYVYADFVTAPGKDVAPMESVYSGEAEVEIPRKGGYVQRNSSKGELAKFVLYPGEKMSREAIAMLKRFTAYGRKVQKRYKETKAMKVKATWEKGDESPKHKKQD